MAFRDDRWKTLLCHDGMNTLGDASDIALCLSGDGLLVLPPPIAYNRVRSE